VVQSYSYSPFGKVTATTGESNPFQYAGRENDGTGLYFNRRRYYVPEWGRFLSEDPLGFEGGLNRYTYAGNDPINWTDPSGTTAVGPDYWGHSPESLVDRVIAWWNEDPPPPIWTPEFWHRFREELGADAQAALAIIRELRDNGATVSAPNTGGGSGGSKPPKDTRTADQIISQDKKGSIRRRFPREMLENTLAEIENLAAAGNKHAQSALKLLTQRYYRK
jgi:RHS repeat-associated protein